MRSKSLTDFPWGMVTLCSLVLYAATIALKYKSLDVVLGDTDDALRLVQFREFLQHGNWFDMHTNRLGGEEGYTTHWSRIPDAIMAAIYFAIKPFSSADFAEWATRAIYPGLWIIPAFISISLFAFHQTANRLVAVILVLLFATNPATFIQFSAGRIDHHNAQIALAVVAVICAALQKDDWRFAIVSGASIGLMFTIGLEAIPFAIVAAAAVAANYAFIDGGSRAAKGFAVALVASTLLGFAISFAPANYLKTACDALALNLLAAITGGGIVLFLWASSTRLSGSLALRCVGLVAAGACALAIYAGSDPACLSGPFGHVNPAVKPLWLDKVVEMQPLFQFGESNNNLQNLSFVYILVLAFAAVAVLLRVKKNRQNFGFQVLLTGFVVSVLVGAINLRMSTYITWFATPLVCIALIHLMETLPRQRLIAALVVSAVLSPAALNAAITKLPSIFQTAAPQEQATTADCDETQHFKAIAGLTPGLMLTEIDQGPFVLAHSGHSVVAAPYHRISEQILQVLSFFDAPLTEQSLKTVSETGAKYVLICWPENATDPNAKSNSLVTALRSGNAPPWLALVPIPKGNPLRVFSVLDLKPALP